ncbi:MAG: hypothetical protein WBG46_08320 [Nonlabens sp.]
MAFELRFDQEALIDFKEAIDYYDLISASLADEFYKEFWMSVDYLKSDPLHFQLRYRDTNSSFEKISIFLALHYG